VPRTPALTPVHSGHGQGHYCTSFCHYALVLVSVLAHQQDTERSGTNTDVTSCHQNNHLGNSSELISKRLGPGDNTSMVGAAASTPKPHLPYFKNRAGVVFFYNLRACLGVFLFLSPSFSSLSLPPIPSPLCEYGHHMIPPVVTVNWSMSSTLLYKQGCSNAGSVLVLSVFQKN
jgi:hypothetical protein